MDLHAPQIQGFFDVPVDHLDASSVFVPYIKSLGIDDIMLCAPDMGGVHRARAYASHFNADMAIIDKHRKRANEIESMVIIGDVKGRNIILVDDIVDTAGTLTKAASLLIDHGAASVRAFCTHAVLRGQAYERIEASKLTEVVVCDTIPLKKQTTKIKQLSTAALFAKCIQRVYSYESISSLFVKA
jgi:ribose-phosphate pyrophosphokinase